MLSDASGAVAASTNETAVGHANVGTDFGSTDFGDTASVDTVVVGAGVIGLATAWELRRRGLSVAVVDPHPGGGASRAAAGMIAPASEIRYQQSALHPLMTASAGEYPGFVHSVEAAAGRDVGYRRTETLVCAVDPADGQALADLQQFQVQQGMQVEQLTGRAARVLEPALTPRLAAAFRAAGDHQIDPRRLLAGLLAALDSPTHRPHALLVQQRAVALLRAEDGPRASGGLPADNGRVTGIRLADGRTICAAETVLATGATPGGIAGLSDTLKLPLRPVYGDILRTRLPAGSPPLIERTIRGLVNGVAVYLVPRVDGEIVIGATSREDAMAGVSAGGVFRLLRDAQALVPAAADLELVEAMARARPGTPDDLPLLGRITSDTSGELLPGLVVSTGYFRHGVLLAPLAARLAAQLVKGNSEPGTCPQETGGPRTCEPRTSEPRTSESRTDADMLAAAAPERFAEGERRASRQIRSDRTTPDHIASSTISTPTR